jgi:hypothetical protein
MFFFIFTAKVEELLTEIKETEAEVVRWREACELEVEAAKKAIEEREKLVNKITSTLPGWGGGGDGIEGPMLCLLEQAALEFQC